MSQLCIPVFDEKQLTAVSWIRQLTVTILYEQIKTRYNTPQLLRQGVCLNF